MLFDEFNSYGSYPEIRHFRSVIVIFLSKTLDWNPSTGHYPPLSALGFDHLQDLEKPPTTSPKELRNNVVSMNYITQLGRAMYAPSSYA